MEREAFRQRMQQYKQARESNPQLKYWDWKKENDLGYQLYKNNLPSNLQVETDDYDLYGAYESNMQPELNEDGTYHLGSRDPYTGRILKSKQHPTYQKAIESEISAGYFPYEKNNVTYTKTYSPIDISGYADGSSGIPGEWKRNPDGSLVMVEDENGEKVPVKSQQKYDYGNKIRSTSSPRLTEEERQQIEIRNQRRADKIRHEVNLVQGALNDVANNRPSSNVITEARKKQEESAVDKFYPYKLMGNSLLEASKLGLAGAGLINGIRALRNVPVSTIGQAAELAGMGMDMLEGINSVTNKKWAESVENLVQVGSGELGRRNYRPYDEYDAVTGQLKNPGIGKYKGLVGLGVLGNIYQIYDSVNNMTDNIQEADSYSDGGIVDEDPPQTTSERPITNFDPKGDPYNPIYGYNPGAGYVSNSDPLGSLYVEGALLNPVFKLAGKAVSNVTRGLTKYFSKYVSEVKRTVWDKIINSIPSNTLRPTTDVTDYINDQFIQRQMSFGKNSGKVIHADYGDLHSGFTKGTTGARVTDKGLVPGHNPNTDIDYSWWNADKPYSYSINNNKFTRYMSGNESDIPGIITVREQTYPIGQWNGKSGFVLKTEKVTPQTVPMDNIDTFQYDPILKTYSRVKYKSYIDGGIIDEDPPQTTAAYLQFATPGQYTKWFNKIPLLGTYPIVNEQFQNYEEDKDKAGE